MIFFKSSLRAAFFCTHIAFHLTSYLTNTIEQLYSIPMSAFFFLLSGLFLGWSLGANDAANIFGTAVVTRVVRFRLAAILCSIFVIIGAVYGGKGTSATLGQLAAIPFLSAAFTVALACALTLFVMTRLKLPVSSSQAIIGALLGWNFFAGQPVNLTSLGTIVSTWMLSPVLAAGAAIVLYVFFRFLQKRTRVALATSDMLLRWGLIVAGIFGAYSLGANNIANVVGIFIPSNPFPGLTIGWLHFQPLDLLLFTGGIAIALGVITYSKNVMMTVGSDIFRLTPLTGFIVVTASALSLFLFGSSSLQQWLIQHKLPSFPLVPVSSSQAIVGAVLGVGLLRNITSIRWKTLIRIALGWVATPISAVVVAFLLLTIMQNVFTQEVREKTVFIVKPTVREKIMYAVPPDTIANLDFKPYTSERVFREILREKALSDSQIDLIVKYSRYTPIVIDNSALHPLFGKNIITKKQQKLLSPIAGHFFPYRWEFEEKLAQLGPEWSLKPDTPENAVYNAQIRTAYEYMYSTFSKSIHSNTYEY